MSIPSRLAIYHSNKENPTPYVALVSNPVTIQLLVLSLQVVIHEQKQSSNPYNLVYMYCLLTLLSLNIPACTGLEVGPVDLEDLFRLNVGELTNKRNVVVKLLF